MDCSSESEIIITNNAFRNGEQKVRIYMKDIETEYSIYIICIDNDLLNVT